jgi:hypothetical protein
MPAAASATECNAPLDAFAHDTRTSGVGRGVQLFMASFIRIHVRAAGAADR